MRKTVTIILAVMTVCLFMGCMAIQSTTETISDIKEAVEVVKTEVKEEKKTESIGPELSVDGPVTFSSASLSGETLTEEIFQGNKVIMVNIFASWCLPCIGEMPNIEKLYQNYKDQGFLVLGVYPPDDEAEDVQDIVGLTKVTYPIVKCDESLEQFLSGYVPTTFFLDGEGRLLSRNSIVGAKSYKDWETILKGYLG